MRVLITGGSGLLGGGLAYHHLKNPKSDLEPLFGCFRNPIPDKFTFSAINLADIDMNSFEDILKRNCIDAVIHSAAVTDIEYCERYPHVAYEINVGLTELISKVCLSQEKRLIFISSDQIYRSESFSREGDIPHPLNVYAKTKLNAEEKVLQANISNAVLRTNFYGHSLWGTNSFSTHILSSITNGHRLHLFRDVYFNPVSVGKLYKILEILVKDSSIGGVLNVCCMDKISKYDFGMLISNLKGLNSTFITKNSLSDRTDLVSRPYDMSMCGGKLRSLLGFSDILAEEMRIELDM